MSNEQTTPAPAPKPAEPPKAETSERKDGAGVPADKIEFDVDDEAGTVSTTVGGVGWPEGAENEANTGADGNVVEDEG